MDGAVMADLLADLDEFVRDVFRHLIYGGQRRWAWVYLRGLMLPGLKRKSVQPMAATLGVPEQNLGHFVGVTVAGGWADEVDWAKRGFTLAEHIVQWLEAFEDLCSQCKRAHANKFQY